MKRIKSISTNSLEKKENLNLIPKKLFLLPLDNISKEQIVSQEQKVLTKLAYNQLPLKSFSEEINNLTTDKELDAYKNNLQKTLDQFNHIYKQEKAKIEPIDIKSIEYLSGLHQETKDRLLESNLFDLIIRKLTIDYFKNCLNQGEIIPTEFDKYKKIISSIYKLQLQLTLKETLFSYNDILLEYLFNESNKLTTYELLQQITVINQYSIGLKYYVKTIKGTGDFYAKRDNLNDYIEVELKSGDLENQPLIKLLFKIQKNYLHLKEILFFIDGDKELILDLMEQNNIILPKNIDFNFINTKEVFTDDNYKYFTHNSKDIAFQEIYKSLNKHGFKKEVDKLVKQSMVEETINLEKYENLLNEHYPLEWFEICQEIGETFLDLNKPISVLNTNENCNNEH